MKTKKLGVIVGRFQTPVLHTAHTALIDEVRYRHPGQAILIVLGVSPVRGTRRDPLDFETRKVMIHNCEPGTIIVPLDDQGSDHVWSQNLDKVIKLYAPHGAILYGGRDNFFSHYHGRYPTKAITSIKQDISATELRKEVGLHPGQRDTEAFRNGVIYTAQNQFPRVFMTVDIAVLRNPHQVLLGRKSTEDGWRFPGGFVDPGDTSLEIAAKRELMEEAPGISVEGPIEYMGSFQMNDWRYKNTTDRIVTAFFKCDYTFGYPKAGDDLAEVAWYPLTKVTLSKVWEPHQILFKQLLSKPEPRIKIQLS